MSLLMTETWQLLKLEVSMKTYFCVHVLTLSGIRVDFSHDMIHACIVSKDLVITSIPIIANLP